VNKNKFPSRFSFVKSHGISGNSAYAWSFVNEEKKFVLFGAWTDLINGGKQLIFSDAHNWTYLNGRRQSWHTHSSAHIELILEEDYKLFTFRQIPKPRNDKTKPASWETWIEEFRPKELLVDGLNYYAVDITATKNANVNYFEKSENHQSYWEGNQTTKLSTKYERSPEARAVCLSIKGYSCEVCEFDFFQTYGEVGKNYIHVHHTVRVADRKRPYIVDPIEDLVPLCPNCHAMAHKKVPPYSVKELKSIINKAKAS